MNKFTRYLFPIALFWILTFAPVHGQTSGVVITGPTTLCQGECAFFQAVPNTGQIAQIIWQVSGAPTYTINPIQVCANLPVPITVFVSGVTSQNVVFFDTIIINVVTALNPSIISTSALCPDSASTCDRVCAFSTATYELAGVSASLPVEWEVLGAESYTTNGNTVAVNWGPAGQGQVSANIGTGGSDLPMQIFCGQFGIDPTSPGTLKGSAFIRIHNAAFPVIILLTEPNGNISTYTSSSDFFTLPGLSPGTYTFTVTDQAGNTETCNFNITVNDSDCWITTYPGELGHTTNCTTCDGFIQMATLGSSQLAFTYLWSTGASTPSLNNLCPGFYTVTVVNSTGCSTSTTIQVGCNSSCNGTASLCVEILEEPKAVISSLPAAAGGVITVCQGQTVFFKNESLNATSYAWDFGDLNTSALFGPSHTYQTPGTYTVSLIARNACFCSDTAFVTVEVLAADMPAIFCTGTVCEGETVTYSTDANCGTYNWSISGGGTVLDGGGPVDNFITVQWTSGPEGTISLDVAGCAGSVCNIANVVPIPVISDNVKIQGPAKVCEGSVEEYFIPDFAGTEILWTVLGSGNITAGQGTERITVSWFGNANIGNPQRVIVEFFNCYLGCGGKDTLLVSILPGFYVTGPIEVCESTSGIYQSRNTITGGLMNSNWQLLNAAGTVVWASAAATNSANIPFNLPPGSYTVRATAASAAGFCNNTYDIFVKLVGAPPPPTSIIGPVEICPGTNYSYEAMGQPNTSFSWTVTGGLPATFSGNPATITWGAAPPYSLSVVQIAKTGLGCFSQPITLTVSELPAFSITGDGQVCRETNGVYAVPFFENLDYQWEIMPLDAGTVVNGAGTESAEVRWHRDGPATVQVTVCGSIKTFNVTVLPLPVPQVPDVMVCAGQSIMVSTTSPFSSYTWKNESGTVISFLPNPTLSKGNYQAIVTDNNGCMGSTTFSILENPLPTAKISTPSYFALCSGGPPAVIYALDAATGYNYQWTLNGSPVGGNTPTYSTNTPGTYQVLVTNQFGCTALSNPQTLVDCEAIGGTCVGGQCYGTAGGPPVPGGTCFAAGLVDFNPAVTNDCNKIDFVNTSVNFIPGTFFWDFGDPGSGAANTSTLQNPSHTFTEPGFYTVLLLGQVNAVSPPGATCLLGLYKDIVVPVVADFSYEEACPGVLTAFTDLSEFIASIGNIIAWSWNFGDPGSGAANTSILQNPTHTYAIPGSYTVNLTVTDASGCQTSVSKMVTVQAPPIVSFNLPSATCEQTALSFTTALTSNVASLTWNFGDPASGAANSATTPLAFHSFPTPGGYTVTLTATTIFGCTDSNSSVFTVTPNTLGGNISYSPPSPICQGESIVLTSPPGGIAWDWSTAATSESITVSQSGVYRVTLTDATGCSYSPPLAPVQVFGEPNGIIKAVVYNEFGQPVAFFENHYSVCEGEDVTLLIQGSLNYSYVWSNGEPGNEISFTEDKGTLLPVGTHNFTVTVTDNLTGCTSIEGPFTVTVHPKPSVQIESMPTGFLCENTTATLNVTGPDPLLAYNWNTGEIGTGITVVAGGTYFVQATNQFGCRSRSNEITLQNAPDINKIPDGCHSRCTPDTMCLPMLPDVVSYQWYFNGVPIAGPNGSLANPIFNQSGEYYVEMTDVYGCTSTSDVLSLDLYPGFGNILGTVWLDVNQNGIIDGADTPVPGVSIILGDGAGSLASATSGGGGGYVFVNMVANNYTLSLDTTSLPTGWQAYFTDTLLNLSGCGGEAKFDWLLSGSCTGVDTTSLALQACPDSTVTYQGQALSPGMMQNFTLQTLLGCDSVVLVSVSAFQTTTLAIDAVACEGSFFDFNGTLIPAGSGQIFTQINADGCLDTIIVGVFALPSDSTNLSLSVCDNSPVTYQGQQLFPGEVRDFTLTNAFGCDSVVTVTVLGGQADTTVLNLQICEGETILFNGQTLAAGDLQGFIFQNQQGCDSIVQVSVTSFPAVSFDLAGDEICSNASTGTIAVQNISGGVGPFLFSLDGTTFQANTFFEALAPGSYSVFVQDGNGCIYDKTAGITAVPPITLETQDETIACGDSVRLAPVALSQLPITWQWPDGSTLPTFWVKSPGIYTVKVSNACETLEGAIGVSPKPFEVADLVYMPNSFSPNGDGINDCYRGYVSPRVALQFFVLKIFDRWGNMMFETNDPNDCWDGYFKGKPMDPAVFVWFIEAQATGCEGQPVGLFEKGGLHLMK